MLWFGVRFFGWYVVNQSTVHFLRKENATPLLVSSPTSYCFPLKCKNAKCDIFVSFFFSYMTLVESLSTYGIHYYKVKVRIFQNLPTPSQAMFQMFVRKILYQVSYWGANDNTSPAKLVAQLIKSCCWLRLRCSFVLCFFESGRVKLGSKNFRRLKNKKKTTSVLGIQVQCAGLAAVLGQCDSIFSFFSLLTRWYLSHARCLGHVLLLQGWANIFYAELHWKFCCYRGPHMLHLSTLVTSYVSNDGLVSILL